MTLAVTVGEAALFWVVACFTIAGAWCAALEITRWRQRRRIARRRAARGGFLFDRDRDRIGL